MEFIDLNRYGELDPIPLFLSIGSFNILIDSGLHPKKLGKDSLPDFNKIQGKTIDLIILTHCHLDHLGSLPHRRKSRSSNPNKFTESFASSRMLRNSINVMKRQREEYGMTDYPSMFTEILIMLNAQSSLSLLKNPNFSTKTKTK